MNKLLNVEWAIMRNLYREFHSAYFYYKLENLLKKYKVNESIYCLLKGNSICKKEFDINLREYL